MLKVLQIITILFFSFSSYCASIYGVLGNPEKYLDEKVFLVGYLVRDSGIKLYPHLSELLIPRGTESILIDEFKSRISLDKLDCFNTYVSVVGVVKSTNPIVLDDVTRITRVNKEGKFDPNDLCWSFNEK